MPNLSSSKFQWIALTNPTREDLDALATKLNIEVPDPEAVDDIELSENLYVLDGNIYLTAQMLTGLSNNTPRNHAITFIITQNTLVTISYIDFKTVSALYMDKSAELSSDKIEALLLYIIESLVSKLSSLLSSVGRKADSLSHSIFRAEEVNKGSGFDFTHILKTIGSSNDIISYISESLTSFHRLLSFARRHICITAYPSLAHDLDILVSDILALNEQANFESNKLMFMLDATLGLINIEQNSTIKIFSILSVIFMPPTLVASMYGMNFQNMPELSWGFGYPLAIMGMFASAIGTYGYFRYKKWM